MSEIISYEKEELNRMKQNRKFGELEKFALDNAGNGKVYKLRELLYKFEPIILHLYMVGVCGNRIKVKLTTFDFPDGEHRVGIEFSEVYVEKD